MSTNRYSLKPLSSTQLQDSVTAKTNLIYGGSISRATWNTARTNAAASTLLDYSNYGQYLNVLVFGDSSVSGGEITIYAGPDDNYPKVMNCAVGASECKNPIATPMLFPNGWSIYGHGDATNYIDVSYQTYTIAPTAETEITICTDTQLREDNPTTNYGSGQSGETRQWTSGTAYTQLWKFDLSSIPAGSTIVNAFLSLDMYATADLQAAQLFAVTSEWIDLEATWNERKTGVSWASPGGDYRVTPEWSGALLLGTNERFEPNITSLVQEWIDGSLDNNGVILVAPNIQSGEEAKIWHMNAVTPSNRPKLYVQY